MSIVLSAYSVQAYKEFVLPAVDNTETSLLLERKVFHTHEDVTL